MEWECGTDGDEDPSAGSIEASPDPAQPGTDPVRGARHRVLGEELCRRVGRRHSRKLEHQTSVRVDELREKGTEEKQSLRVCRCRQ
jgi:hypothetical protein